MEQGYQLIDLMLPVAGAIATIGGAFLTIQKIRKNALEAKEMERSAVLSHAKEEMALMRSELEAKIAETKAQLHSLEANVEKDLSHMKETYNGEIRNLGEKIELLRTELRSQHGSLVSLLTKMIDK